MTWTRSAVLLAAAILCGPLPTRATPPEAAEPAEDDDDPESPGLDEVAPPDAEPAARDLLQDVEPQPSSNPTAAEEPTDALQQRLLQLQRDFSALPTPDVDHPREEHSTPPLPANVPLPVGLDVLEMLGTQGLTAEVAKRRAADARTLHAALYRSLLRPAAARAATSTQRGAPLGPTGWDIPAADHDMVRMWVKYFQGSGQKYYRLWVARYWRYGPTMRSILQEEGLPQDLVFLSMIESGFSPKAYSFANAAGQWQFIRATGQRMGLTINYWLDERRDPIKSTRAAARYLQELYKDLRHWHLAWAGYNAGPGRVKKAIRRTGSREFFVLAKGPHLRKETRNYVPKLLAAAIIGKDPAAFGFGDVEPLSVYSFDELPLADNVHLSAVAAACESSVDDLLELNPMLRRPITPPVAPGGAPFLLRIPPGALERCQAGLTRLPPDQQRHWRRHIARPGDSVASLAQRYQTTAQAIMEENALTLQAKLRAGEDLLIPVPAASAVPVGDLEDDVHERRGKVARAAPPRGTRSIKVMVKPGDTLWDIAAAYHVDVRSVVAWNGLGRKRRLRAGQHVILHVPPQAAPRSP